MIHTIAKKEQSTVELTITVAAEEYQKDMETAAVRLSQRTAVKGFRPGKVPYEMMKKEIGEMPILQEALESVVQRTFFEAVTAEKLETVGMPSIHLEKVAPGNELVYKATVATLPAVTVPDLKTLKITKHEPSVDQKKIDETLDAVRGMQAVEVVKSGEASGTDKLVVDMDMKLDGVPVEGGQSKDHQVYLSEEHYIPGFNKELAGLKKGDTKTFTLPFPKEHYQKQLAGKDVEISVTVKEVYERQLPEIDDEFAKRLGQTSAQALRDRIAENVKEEATKKAEEKTEIELLDTLIEKTKFDEIPQVLIDNEKQKMYHELLRDLERHGVDVAKYLEDIKKTEKELFEDFKTQAEKRAKAALISRQIAKEQNISVSKEELDAEVGLVRGMYKNDEEIQKRLEQREVRETIAVTLQNKKVMKWLHEQLFGEKE